MESCKYSAPHKYFFWSQKVSYLSSFCVLVCLEVYNIDNFSSGIIAEGRLKLKILWMLLNDLVYS